MLLSWLATFRSATVESRLSTSGTQPVTGCAHDCRVCRLKDGTSAGSITAWLTQALASAAARASAWLIQVVRTKTATVRAGTLKVPVSRAKVAARTVVSVESRWAGCRA